MIDRLRETLRLLSLSARMVAGRRYWIVPAFVLPWSLYHVIAVLAGWQEEAFDPTDAQGLLIGVPLTVMAIGLGVRIVASEIDRRTLEIAYTVPGGAHRIWLARLGATIALLLAAELLLGASTFFLLTDFPPAALYGALQAAVFYLVLAMALSTLFKGEATGAMATVAVLVLNGLVTGFGGNQLRISPFWNPTTLAQSDPADVLAWTVQNRVGFVLVMSAITVLAFTRAENREKMLG